MNFPGSNEDFDEGDDAGGVPTRFIVLALLSDSEKLLTETLERAESLMRANTPGQFSVIQSELMAATGCSSLVAAEMMGFVGHAARIVASLPPGVGPKDANNFLRATEQRLVSQCVNDGFRVPKTASGRLHRCFARLAERAAALRRSHALGHAVLGVLPMLTKMSASVELRALRLPGEDEHSIEFAPIASVRVQLDSGEPSEFCFQITDADLLMLQRKIGVLRADLAAAQSRVLPSIEPD